MKNLMGRRCRRSNASRNVRHRRKFKFFHIFELWRYIGRTILAHTVATLGQRWGSGGRAQRIERRTPRRIQASKETNTDEQRDEHSGYRGDAPKYTEAQVQQTVCGHTGPSCINANRLEEERRRTH